MATSPPPRGRWSATLVVHGVDVEVGRRDVAVEVAHPATVGTVADAVGLPAAVDLAVDGRTVPRDATAQAAGLVDGAELCVATPHDLGTATDDGAVVLLRHTAGLAAGGSTRLPAGGHHVGPAPGEGLQAAQPTRTDFTLRLGEDGTTVLDARTPAVQQDGSGFDGPRTLADAPIALGSDVFELVPVEPPPRGAVGHGPWHRQPRPVPPPAAAPPSVPAAPVAPGPPSGLSWILMLAPVPVAIVMAIVLNPFFLAFAAMGPVMMGARWLEGRRSFRRGTQRHTEELAAARTATDDLLSSLRHTEQRRRREAHPDPAETVARATRADPRLWQRRHDHHDAGVVSVATGRQSWTLPVDDLDASAYADLARSHGVLHDVPLTADLHRPLGLAGPAATTAAVARHVLSALATTHGPADLELAVVVAPDRAAAWEWLKWLPHLDPSRACTEPAAAAAMVRRWVAGDRPAAPATGPVVPRGPLRVVLLDHPDAVREPSGVLRRALATPPDQPGAVSAVVLSHDRETLPASVASVVVAAPAEPLVRVVDADGTTTPAAPRGLAPHLAERVARSLARWRDPEQASTAGSLPERVRLADLLDLDDLADTDATASHLADRWRDAGTDPPPAGPVGASADGPLWLDLAADGPHGLLAGTTGSGKSELLRSLVAGMAATNSPERLTFVLVDYKGGGAFDAVVDLPHVVAVVTDLDGHLAERALRSLQAELRWREQLLREHGSTDLTEHRRAGAPGLPRLAVVIDEFATLANELPTFLDALVDIAQRGRSLGVHLLLATQRPSGVLDAKIRANTNIRVALRVQDENDALDVVGVKDPALLPRRAVGRGHVRLGASEVVAFQAAWTGGVPPSRSQPDRATPFTLLPRQPDRATASADDVAGHAAADEPDRDLDLLVAATARASRLAGCTPPRQVWHPALPAQLDVAGVGGHGEGERASRLAVGLRDLPDRQLQEPFLVDLDQHVLVYGVDAPVVASTVATLVLGLAGRASADDAHVHVLDQPSRPLAPLAGLPHLGGYASHADLDLLVRLLDTVERELDRRREVVAATGSAASLPLALVVVNGLDALLDTLNDDARQDLVARLLSLPRHGNGLRTTLLATASHDRGIPLRLVSQVDARLVHRLADPNGYLTFGLRPAGVPDLQGAQAIDVATGDLVVVARHHDGDLAGAVRRIDAAPATRTPPPAVRTLHTTVAAADVAGAGSVDGGVLRVPVGLSVDDLEPCCLTLDERVLVVGPPRSGRTSALAAIVAGVRDTDPDRPITVLTPSTAVPDEPPPAGSIVVVDDVDRLRDEAVEHVKALLETPPAGGAVVVASRHEAVKDPLGWLRVLRGNRHGLVLAPQPTDGEVFRVLLPLRGAQRMPPGRAFVVDAAVPTLVQLVEADGEPSAALLGPAASMAGRP